MNLHLKSLDLNSIIKECLHIESVEYCYVIPILAETAEYSGDSRLTYLCNMMSRHGKEYFNHAAHVHLYISKEPKFIFQESSTRAEPHLLTHMGKYYQDIRFKTKHTDYQFIQKKKANFDILKGLTSISLDICETQKKSCLRYLTKIDNDIFEILENIQEISYTKSFSPAGPHFLTHKGACAKNSTTLPVAAQPQKTFASDNSCFLLLKSLRSRKLWKANIWYPLLANIAYNQKMVNISNNFMQISKMEKKTSRMLMQMIQQKSY